MSNRKKRFEKRLKARRKKQREATAKEPSLHPELHTSSVNEMMLAELPVLPERQKTPIQVMLESRSSERPST